MFLYVYSEVALTRSSALLHSSGCQNDGRRSAFDPTRRGGLTSWNRNASTVCERITKTKLQKSTAGYLRVPFRAPYVAHSLFPFMSGSARKAVAIANAECYIVICSPAAHIFYASTFLYPGCSFKWQSNAHSLTLRYVTTVHED